MVDCKLVYSFGLDIGERLLIDQIRNFNHRLDTDFKIFKCVKCLLKCPKSKVKPKDVHAYDLHKICVRNLTSLDLKICFNCKD